MKVLIKKATILSAQSPYHLQQKDIFIVNGIIQKIGQNIPAEKNYKIIEGKDLYASCGWVDIFANFADPGYEFKEDIQTGMQAAASGGFTDVFLLPNTLPSICNKGQIEYLKNKSANNLVSIYPIGAISKNIEGTTLAEMYDMQNSGAIAFSDGLKPIQNSGLLLKALLYIKSFNGIIIQLPIEESLTQQGLINEGEVSTQLGMQGKIDIAEHLMIHRDIELLRYTESKLHITGISTAKSVEIIRNAKKDNLQITCSVTPYHLLFTDEQLKTYNSIYKVDPPLRTETDRKAMLDGILDGTIDCITTHHNPQDWDNKNIEFEYAKYGMIGLETLLHQLLSIPNSKIKMEKWIELLSTNPRKIFGLNAPIINTNENACITVFSTTETTEYNMQTKKSKGLNSPFLNETLKGKIVATINNNQTCIN